MPKEQSRETMESRLKMLERRITDLERKPQIQGQETVSMEKWLDYSVINSASWTRLFSTVIDKSLGPHVRARLFANVASGSGYEVRLASVDLDVGLLPVTTGSQTLSSTSDVAVWFSWVIPLDYKNVPASFYIEGRRVGGSGDLNMRTLSPLAFGIFDDATDDGLLT